MESHDSIADRVPTRQAARRAKSRIAIALSVSLPLLFVLSRVLRTLEFSRSNPPEVLFVVRVGCLLALPIVSISVVVFCLFFGDELSGKVQVLACVAVLLTWCAIVAGLIGALPSVFPFYPWPATSGT